MFGFSFGNNDDQPSTSLQKTKLKNTHSTTGHTPNDHTRHVRAFRKQTVKDQLGLKNRLSSIANDADEVEYFHSQQFPHLPLFANKRCGQWYVAPSHPPHRIAQPTPVDLSNNSIGNSNNSNNDDNNSNPHSFDTGNDYDTINTIHEPQSIPTRLSYYKSTDGHYNTWNFSLSRLNLNVLETLLQPHTTIDVVDDIYHYYKTRWVDNDSTESHTPLDITMNAYLNEKEIMVTLGNNNTNHSNHNNINTRLILHGGCIVDSTRKGKEFPDSFTRTIPIWCGTINKTFHDQVSDGNNNQNNNQPGDQKNTTTYNTHDIHFSSAPWMLGTETDQICSKIDQQHVESFVQNIGVDKVNYYSRLYNAATSTPVGINDNNSNSNQFGKLVPLWLHREYYQSSIDIMNNNLFYFLTQYCLPMVSQPASTDQSIEQQTTQNVNLHFIIVYLYHFIQKYNLGCYVNLFRYINQKPTLNKLIISFMFQYFQQYGNIDSVVPKTEIDIILLLTQFLSKIIHIPIILYSSSLVDRVIRSYNGSNVIHNKNTFNSQINTINNTNEGYNENFYQDNNYELFKSLQNNQISAMTSCQMIDTTTSDIYITRQIFYSHLFNQLHGVTKQQTQNNNKSTISDIIQFICPYTFSTINYNTIYDGFVKLQLPIQLPINFIEIFQIQQQQKDNNINNNNPEQQQQHQQQYSSSPYYNTIKSLLSNYNIKTYKRYNMNAQNHFNERYIPGSGDDEETWAKMKVWVLKKPTLRQTKQSTIDNSLSDDGELYEQQEEEYPLIRFEQQLSHEYRDLYQKVMLTCSFEMLYTQFPREMVRKYDLLGGSLYTNTDNWDDTGEFDEDEDFDEDLDEDDDYLDEDNIDDDGDDNDTNIQNNMIRLTDLLPLVKSNEQCWALIYKLFYLYKTEILSVQNKNEDISATIQSPCDILRDTVLNNAFPLFQVCSKQKVIMFSILQNTIAAKTIKDINNSTSAGSSVESSNVFTATSDDIASDDKALFSHNIPQQPAKYNLIMFESQGKDKDMTTNALYNEVMLSKQQQQQQHIEENQNQLSNFNSSSQNSTLLFKAYDIQISSNRTHKNSVQQNISQLLQIVYDCLFYEQVDNLIHNNHEEKKEIDQEQQDILQSRQNLPSHDIHDVHYIIMTNSTLEVYISVMLSVLMFLNCNTTTTNNLDQQQDNSTALEVQSVTQQEYNSNNIKQPVIQQPTATSLPELSQFKPHFSFFNNQEQESCAISTIPDTSLISTFHLSPTASGTLFRPCVGDYNTPNLTYSKQDIRSLITTVINTIQVVDNYNKTNTTANSNCHTNTDVTSSRSATDINITDAFLSRDLQQQMNLYFCPKFTPPVKAQNQPKKIKGGRDQ